MADTGWSGLRHTFHWLSRLRLLRAFLCILICLGLWIVINRDDLVELARAQQARDREAAAAARMEATLARMRAEQRALLSNPEAVELLAREQFKLTRPGERLIIIRREKPAD